MAVKVPDELIGIVDPFDTVAPETPTTDLSGIIDPFDTPVERKPFDRIDQDIKDPMQNIYTSPDPTAEGEMVMDALVKGNAFGLSPTMSIGNKQEIDEAIKNKPFAIENVAQVKSYVDAVSTIGAGWQYTNSDKRLQTPNGQVTDEQIFDEFVTQGEGFVEQGIISQAELDKFVDEKRIPGWWTSAAPQHFYDKSWATRAKETPQSLSAGINGTLGGWFRGVQWLQGETGVNVGARAIADWFEENRKIAAPDRPDFYTDVWQGIGSSVTFVVPQLGVTKVATGIGKVSQSVALAFEITAVSANESLVEAGDTYQSVLNETGDEGKAQKASRITFGANLPMLLVSNRLGMYSGRLKAMKTGLGGLKQTVATGVKGAVGEGIQESLQTLISQVAEEKPIDMGDILYSGLIGATVGGGMSVLLERADGKIKDIPELSKEASNKYDTTVQGGLDSGLSLEKAHIEASKELGETPEGQEYIDKVMQAQESVLQAEAAMGQPELTAEQMTTQAEVAEVVTEEDIKSLVEEDLTDDEIDARIDELITQAETVDVEPVVDEQVQTDTPAFKAFFKDSKVVDESGKPTVVYHGTDAPQIQKFRSRENEFFFTDEISVAQEFGANIVDTFLSLQNPHIVDMQGKTGKDVFDEIDFAKENNFDGVIAQNVSEGSGLPTHTQYVAFNPKQIKSATENTGAFDPLVANIRGSLDLNAEISLAPIIEKLQTFKASPSQGIADITNLGRSIFAEGKTSFNDFTARMKEVLGDLWTSFKNVSKQAWDILNNERGAIGRPEPTKTTVRRTTGQIKGIDRDALRESLRVQARAARTAFREGKALTTAELKAKFNETIETARGKREETARRNQLRKTIKRELKTTKVKTESGKPVGKFTPEVQRTLDQFRSAANLSTIDALERINDNLAQYPDEIPPDNIALENRIISMTHDFGSRTVPELETLLAQIRTLKDEGKMINELRKFNRQARDEKAVIEALDVITGGKGLPEGADQHTRKTNYARITNVTDRAKKWLNGVGKTIVGWDDILNSLSNLDPAKLGTSKLNEIGDVLDNKNAEKDGNRNNTEVMQNMYREAFGITQEGRAGDRQTIKQIEEDSKPIDLGTFTDLEGRSVPIEISKAQARKRWMEFQDPTLDSTFTEGMAYTEDMKVAITGLLTSQDKAYAQAQLDYYQEYYNSVNAVYRDMYGVDLPSNPFYTPIRREGYVDSNSGFGEFLQEINLRPSTAPGGVKTRTKNILPIKFESDISILEQHTSEMERFKAWGEKVRELRAVFNNVEVKAAVEIYHGEDITGVLDNFINDFARGGIDRSKKLNVLDKWRTRIARSTLAVKPAIAVKQLTSFIAYADSMPVSEFVKGTVEFWKNPVENTRFLYENSTLLQNRSNNFERDIKDAQKTDEYQAWRKSQSFMNSLMLNVQMGDQGAIVMGGWPLVDYHMKQGKTKEEAIRIFEKATERTQQSADIDNLSVWQRGGSFAKLFTLYRSSPNLYVRKEIAVFKDVFSGLLGGTRRISNKQAAKTMFIFHVMLPSFFQAVSDGFTWDEEEQKRAVVFGPLNGIFIVGDILDAIVRKALGLRVFDSEIPNMSLADDAVRAIGAIQDDDLTDEEFLKAVRAAAGGIGSLTGIPLKTAVDIGAGIDEILTGDLERGAAQVLGYSPSVAKKISADKARRR